MHGTIPCFCCHSYKKKSCKRWRAKSSCCGDKYHKNDAHTQKHVRRWANRHLLQYLEASKLEQQLLGTRMLEVHRSLYVLTITLQSEYGANAKTLVLNGAPLLQA